MWLFLTAAKRGLSARQRFRVLESDEQKNKLGYLGRMASTGLENTDQLALT
jgi:hypothetical protein